MTPPEGRSPILVALVDDYDVVLAGVANMTAGMLTEGTRTRSAPEIAQQIEALGATLESRGGQESSSVTLNVMPGNLKAAMAIMADVAKNPAFAAEELERQRAQALDGLSVSYQEPGQLAAFAAGPTVFAGTAFGHVAGGTPASVARLATGDLVKLHEAYYRPDNAILVDESLTTGRETMGLTVGAAARVMPTVSAAGTRPRSVAASHPRAMAPDPSRMPPALIVNTPDASKGKGP